MCKSKRRKHVERCIKNIMSNYCKTMYFVAKTFGMQFYVVTYCKLVVKSKGSII